MAFRLRFESLETRENPSSPDFLGGSYADATPLATPAVPPAVVAAPTVDPITAVLGTVVSGVPTTTTTTTNPLAPYGG